MVPASNPPQPMLRVLSIHWIFLLTDDVVKGNPLKKTLALLFLGLWLAITAVTLEALSSLVAITASSWGEEVLTKSPLVMELSIW